jgi:hypothetical protein
LQNRQRIMIGRPVAIPQYKSSAHVPSRLWEKY